METQSLLTALLFAFLVNIATPALAKTPKGTRITGTIQKVDAPNKEIEMQREDKGALLKFTWSSHTTFLANGQTAGAAILKKGAHVEVTYHEPFFGKPFVTKTVLLPASKPAAK